jgi:hypothetical protein
MSRSVKDEYLMNTFSPVEDITAVHCTPGMTTNSMPAVNNI